MEYQKDILWPAIPITVTASKQPDYLREELKWPEDKILVTFQSRFGPEPWLTTLY